MPNKTSILVTGITGQLGRSLKEIAAAYPNLRFVFVGRQQLDLSNGKSITAFFEHNRFDIFINCAAYTAVDKAEIENELADQINHLAVRQLAHISKQQNAKLIHISSDYVFNGNCSRPYIETDEVAPKCVYGQTKLHAEQAILDTLESNAVIIRTSWLYSKYQTNFVKTMLKLGKECGNLNVIFDQVSTPTYAGDLAKAILDIIHSQLFKQPEFKTNLVHYSNEGVCSWYDFAKTIFEITSTSCNVHPIESKDYPTVAKRPHYSVLNKGKIKQTYSLTIPYWKDSLKQCLLALEENAR